MAVLKTLIVSLYVSIAIIFLLEFLAVLEINLFKSIFFTWFGFASLYLFIVSLLYQFFDVRKRFEGKS